MTKVYLAFILLFILPNKMFSQIKITGEIKDEKNNLIEFIEIQLQNKDSIIFKSELTNALGKFIIETEKGEYTLLVRQLGVIYHKQKINAKQDIQIGIIKIIERQQQLQEVVITSKKKLIERKVDRLTFNVENSTSTSGGDAIEALKVTPGIRVQNDAISMIGKSRMLIMVNGKMVNMEGESLINYLKSISSDNIKNIEVISVPPSKYDANGNSGLININFKKLKNDENFNATIRNVSEQRTFYTNTTNGNLNFRKNKIELSSNLSYKNGTYKIKENHNYLFSDQTWKNNNIRKEFNNNISGRLGIDYNINEKQNIGIIYNTI